MAWPAAIASLVNAANSTVSNATTRLASVSTIGLFCHVPSTTRRYNLQVVQLVGDVKDGWHHRTLFAFDPRGQGERGSHQLRARYRSGHRSQTCLARVGRWPMKRCRYPVGSRPAPTGRDPTDELTVTVRSLCEIALDFGRE